MSAPAPTSAAAQLLEAFEAGMDGLEENDLVEEAEVDTVVREAVLAAVGDAAWADARAAPWAAAIMQTCLKKLAAQGKPFKYVVTAALAQRAGAGLHAAAAARCNRRTDGQLCVHWESATVLALVTVYWCAV